VHDLAVIVVSMDQAHWLPRCLDTLAEHAGGMSVDLVIVDNGSDRATEELVDRDYPDARVLVRPNRGFAHANNEALATVDARYVLFLNPDTEFLEGSLAELVEIMDGRDDIGLAGVRQVDVSGRLTPTMRRFPSAVRAFGDALALERLPFRPEWLGERELRESRYDVEFESDWTIGSFMLTRREALDDVGGFDDRFFVYAEEVDLCRRIRGAGWLVVHLPQLTILHRGTNVRALDERMAMQNAYAQLQYASKHLALRYGLRSLPFAGDAPRRRAARAAASLVLGLAEPPFGAGR
jgi:N-acetylglucosaminyl-diphospho-decaprenol L-rhamnosyltransferase